MPYDETIVNAILVILGLICVAGFIHGVAKEPRRISNGILLVLAPVFIINGGLRLWAPDMTLPDGYFAFGTGSEIIFTLEWLLMLISLVGGVALIINGARVSIKEGANLAHLLPIFFGLVALAWPFLFAVSLLLTLDSTILFVARQLLWSIILYVPGMLAAFLFYSFVYAALPKRKDPDFILVLGAGLDGNKVTPLLAKRLDRAIKLFEAGGRKAQFVVSGGRGADEPVSEAQAMKNYLLECKIPVGKIIMEDRSTNTQQNIKFSKAIMQNRKKDYTCVLVTSNYHVLRAVILARSLGLDAQGVGGKTKLYYLPAAFIREYIAVIFNYKNLALAYVAIAVAVFLLSMAVPAL